MPNITKSELEALRRTWAARVEDFRTSGQIQRDWCESNHVSVRQLQYWLRKFSHEESQTQSPSTTWMSIHLDESLKGSSSPDVLFIRVGPATIEVREGYSPSLLLEVVKTLEKLC